MHPSSSVVCDQRAPLPAGPLVLALWGGGTVGAHIPAPPSSTAVPAQLSAVSKDNGKVSRAAPAGEAGAGRKGKVSAALVRFGEGSAGLGVGNPALRTRVFARSGLSRSEPCCQLSCDVASRPLWALRFFSRL